MWQVIAESIVHATASCVKAWARRVEGLGIKVWLTCYTCQPARKAFDLKIVKTLLRP
jgi:hypothetical protein